MKSFTELRNLYGSLTNNSDSTNLTLGDQLINDNTRLICEARPWYFLEKTKTASTVASQQGYTLPFDYKKLIDVTVTIGTYKYTPKECPSREYWDYINASTTSESDTPLYYFVFNGQLNFWPIPSSSTSNAITYSYIRAFRNMSVADYTTGTVDAVTGTTVTGSGTTWASPMAGRYLRIDPTNVATSSGDGMWYEISTVGSSTSITLSVSYNGTALSSGAAATYTIGDMPILPEAYQVLPVYRACEFYFSTKTEDLNRAQYFKRLYDEGMAGMIAFYGRKTSNVVIGSTDFPVQNPNSYITLT